MPLSLVYCYFHFGPFFSLILPPVSVGITVNPIARRKTKIVYNFGLSECNRVKGVEGTKLNAHLF